jgi:hypothetical protein
MQVVYHLGAPCTDNDMLVQSLLKNRTVLASDGVIVPPPSRYRNVMRDTARALKGGPANEDVAEALLDAIVDDAHVDRLILSDPRFICINRLVVQGAQIWPMIERQATMLRNLFPEMESEFFIGMRDPTTLIPALFKSSRFTDFGEFAENMQPHAIAWSEMIRRLRVAHPECGVTVWCNEDTPLIWGDILREMAGYDHGTVLEGELDLIETIMDPAGFRRMQAYLTDHTPETALQRRRIIAAFLDRYALDAEIEEELDVPGWTEDMVAEISESYDADMAHVARIPGVTFIAP